MKLPLFLFLVLVAMSVVVGWVMIAGESGERHGVQHVQYKSTMKQGGSGQQRHDDLRWLGWAFGGLQIVFFSSCLLLGVKNAGHTKWPFLIGGLLYLATFTWLAIADHAYARHQPAPLVFCFPLPTALMLYGMWGVPCVFLLIYMVKFDRWILTPKDLQRFEALLSARQGQQKKG